jgi:hypothetical protein
MSDLTYSSLYIDRAHETISFDAWDSDSELRIEIDKIHGDCTSFYLSSEEVQKLVHFLQEKLNEIT